MNAAEKHFLTLANRYRVRYLGLVERFLAGEPTDRAWIRYGVSLLDIARWSDIGGASRMRLEALGERLHVPDRMTVGAMTEANPWMSEHILRSNPIIEWRVKQMLQAERFWLHQNKERLQNDPDAEPLPAWRAELAYRNMTKDIKSTAEEIQLSQPEVGEHFPFTEYVTRNDRRVRDTHRQMNGTVWLRSWEHAGRCRPPAGHRCRCVSVYRTWQQAIARGWASAPKAPRFEVRWSSGTARNNFLHGLFPDPGFQKTEYTAPFSLRVA